MQREHVERLLRHGAIVTKPGPEMLAAASHLEQIGLIRVHPAEFVRCADPADADFSRTNRHCRGRIYLEGRVRDFRCPECERRVFPDMDVKRRYGEMGVEVLPHGVLAYVSALLEEAQLGPRSICEGVLRANAGPLGVFVCVADFCEDPKFLARDWAGTQPTCYVTIDPAAADRFLDEAWLCRVGLAELVCGDVDLTELVEKAAASGPPSCVRHVSIPVYTKAVRPRGPDQTERRANRRLFVVELSEGVILVEGQRVAAVQAVTRYQVFRVLWQQFVEDLRHGRPPDEFRPTDLDTMIRRLRDLSGREIVDEVSIRRAINRLQTDIMATIRRRLGLPIDRDDVVEACRWKGQAGGGHGYRLNPRCVAVRPASS